MTSAPVPRVPDPEWPVGSFTFRRFRNNFHFRFFRERLRGNPQLEEAGPPAHKAPIFKRLLISGSEMV